MLALVSLAALWKAGWFDRGRRPVREATGLPAVGWLVVAVAAFFGQAVGAGLGLVVLGSVLGEGLETTSAAAIFGAIGAVVTTAGAFSVIAPKVSIARRSGLTAAWRDSWVGALVCLAAIPLVSVTALVATLAAGGGDPLTHETLRQLATNDSAAVWALTAVAVVVAAPVGEELIFRGLLQTGFSRAGLGPAGGVVAASGAFLLVHASVLDAQMMPALFVLSVVLGLSYERTGRLGGPIVAHACFNAFNLWASGV